VAQAVFLMALRHSWGTAGSVLSTALFLALPPANSQTTAAGKPPKSEEKIENAQARAVRHQLQELPFYSVFDNINYSIDGEKVTLTGQVRRPTLKANAEAAIKSLEGVSAVANNIEVLPHSSADHELRRNVYRALFEDATLQKYAIQAMPPIHIIVKNGAVTLEGTVDSEADKALASSLVGKVQNVASLQSNLVVQKREASPK
jgi:hyperosmotically inducible protein